MNPYYYNLMHAQALGIVEVWRIYYHVKGVKNTLYNYSRISYEKSYFLYNLKGLQISYF